MLIQADARALPLRDGCVQCVVTSPPYYALRNYGVDQQIGLEDSPADYVFTLVAVFREVRRVLADDGVLWLNLGDCYNNLGGGGFTAANTLGKSAGQKWMLGTQPSKSLAAGLKAKDLLGIPWRVAFALQADGWYLRSDVIWAKPNPMPESVTDRPTKSHEYLFLLTKQERYYYDAQAIAEPINSAYLMARWGGSLERTEPDQPGDTISRSLPTGRARALGVRRYSGTATKDYDAAGAQDPSATKARIVEKAANGELLARNKRTVWTIPTMPYAGAHFATMPEKLVEPCILAGSRPGDLILDPFSGSGTVLAVAQRFGRRAVGVDLNPAYHQLAKARTAQRGLRWDAVNE